MIETFHAIATEIIGLERAALDRWGKGDPSAIRFSNGASTVLPG